MRVSPRTRPLDDGSDMRAAASVGLIYRSPRLYRLAMGILYRGRGGEGRRTIAAAIPPGASVVDLCCGDCAIAPEVRAKGCRYLGLDINPAFVRSGRRRGHDVRCWDARSMPIPRADVVCMLAGLYQFIPNDGELFTRMVQSADRLVVLAEPVRNWTASRSRLLRGVARMLTQVDGQHFEDRHTEASIRALLAHLPPHAVTIRRFHRDVLVLVDTERLDRTGE